MGLKMKGIGIFSGLLVSMFFLVASACASDPEDLPWSNETDVIIFPSPPLPPIFSDFNIEPTEIVLGDYFIISFVIQNINDGILNYNIAVQIGDATMIIEIELEAYESKNIWYRVNPHVAREYEIWIAGHPGVVKVISTEIIIVGPLEELNLRIDELDTSLQDLTVELINLRIAYQDLQDADANLKSDQIHEYEWIVALGQRVDEQDMQIEEQYQTLEYLEDKISTNRYTIFYACIATAIISVLGAFLLIKRMN